jgi:hypothetical protein
MLCLPGTATSACIERADQRPDTDLGTHRVAGSSDDTSQPAPNAMSPAASGLPWVFRRAACGASCTASLVEVVEEVGGVRVHTVRTRPLAGEPGAAEGPGGHAGLGGLLLELGLRQRQLLPSLDGALGPAVSP